MRGRRKKTRGDFVIMWIAIVILPFLWPIGIIILCYNLWEKKVSKTKFGLWWAEEVK